MHLSILLFQNNLKNQLILSLSTAVLHTLCTLRDSNSNSALLQIRQCVLIAALRTGAAAAAAATAVAGAATGLFAVLVQDGVYNFKSFQHIWEQIDNKSTRTGMSYNGHQRQQQQLR